MATWPAMPLQSASIFRSAGIGRPRRGRHRRRPEPRDGRRFVRDHRSPASTRRMSGATARSCATPPARSCRCARHVALPGSGTTRRTRRRRRPSRCTSGSTTTRSAMAIRSFPGLPHRQQLIATVDGVAYVNDSKATNADCGGPRTRLLRPHRLDRRRRGQGGRHRPARTRSSPASPRPADRPRRRGACRPDAGRDVSSHEIAGTLEAAVPACLRAPLPRRTGARVVLLSPACASFDQFSGFDARGDRFAELAHVIGGGGTPDGRCPAPIPRRWAAGGGRWTA